MANSNAVHGGIYRGSFSGSVYISTMTTMDMATAMTTTYITINSHKRASSNTCDAVYFLDRTLQGVQRLMLSNMQ